MIQGAAGVDDPRLRDEPAVGRVLRSGADEGDHALGRGLGGGRGARPAASAACSSRPPAGRACSGSTRAIAAACVPLTLRTVQESRDPNRSRSIDFVGHRLIAVMLVPLVLALSKGSDWGWVSLPRSAASSSRSCQPWLFVVVERRVTAPLVDLQLLRNAILVGATLAILIVAGTINALMYVLSLYFQDPAGFGMSALAGRAGDAAGRGGDDRHHAADHAARRQDRRAAGDRARVRPGRGRLRRARRSSKSSWAYAAFVLPLVVIAVGLGLANGPASSALDVRGVAGRGRPGLRASRTWPATSAARWPWPPSATRLQRGHAQPPGRGRVAGGRAGGRAVQRGAPDGDAVRRWASRSSC